MNKIADTCKVIALANQKGGVAKNFTTASLAVGLVNAGKRVLVIDNDPQGHASRCLGVKKAEKTIYDVMEKLIKGEDLEPSFCIDCIRTTEEGVDLLPSNVKYAMMELELSSAMSREHLLNALTSADNLIVLGDEGQGIAIIKEKGLLNLLNKVRPH